MQKDCNGNEGGGKPPALHTLRAVTFVEPAFQLYRRYRGRFMAHLVRKAGQVHAEALVTRDRSADN